MIISLKKLKVVSLQKIQSFSIKLMKRVLKNLKIFLEKLILALKLHLVKERIKLPLLPRINKSSKNMRNSEISLRDLRNIKLSLIRKEVLSKMKRKDPYLLTENGNIKSWVLTFWKLMMRSMKINFEAKEMYLSIYQLREVLVNEYI